MRTALALLAAVMALPALAAPSHPGYVDGEVFRSLIDETKEVVEVHLDGPMLKAMAKSKKHGDGDDPGETPAQELFGTLDAIHAVIGQVKGPASQAFALVQETDRKLVAAGWTRITRIKDETSWISVLTHVSGDQIDGLVALIFDSEEKELVFANLAGPIDLGKIGEIGDELNVPGLDQIPGAR